MKKVGILGGSFDPVHFGHLNLAISLKELCALDEVLFIPAGISPFKESTPPVAASNHRLTMLQMAVAPVPGARVLDWELAAEGPSYTIDTVRRLSADSSVKLHLLVGEDHLASLSCWKESAELFRLAPPLIGARDIQSQAAYSEEGSFFRIPLFDISSTRVRERLAQKKYCGHLVPAPVLAYIEKNRLYG
jgi:nicotinate-nucleotide adenylyltransferase